MRAHVDALFTSDGRGDLVRVNEPSGAPAPRFFLGRTASGVFWWFRHDVDAALRREVIAAIRDDVAPAPPTDAVSASRFESILARVEPVRRTETGPAFCFPPSLPGGTTATVRMSEANAHLLTPLLEPWLPDVQASQPLVALVADGRAVAVCASVRQTAVAYEAGVETHPSYRRRGYGAAVAAGWAQAVRELGRIPLYSTSWENEASRAVARKLGLICFGSDLHIT